MEGTMNEVDQLVSEVIEITNLNKEVISWILDTRPNEELTSRAILQRVRKANEIKEITSATIKSYVDKIYQFNIGVVPKGAPENHSYFVGYWYRKGLSFKLDNYEHIDVYIRNREAEIVHPCDEYCRNYSVRFENEWYDHAHSMREVTKYIEIVLNEVDEITEFLSLIDSSAGEFFRRQDITKAMSNYESKALSFTQFDFDPMSVWSARYGGWCNKNQAHKITEVRLQEKIESRGYVAFFTEHVSKANGQMYSRELPTLLINEVDGVKGPNGPVRLLWRDKGKTIIGRNPISIHKQHNALADLMSFLNKIYKPYQC
jgi:hypothetical protein